ncbi:TetR/AcrR family transcriptional regulator [Herbidospora sp. NBRC 101105]|uniref:TetR/AcrR family transcriptional regulator n=1 Tax=Herbidospora sp. NBRC 101105 TaxID=3032195 RepID=UPI0024A12F77|nr:TetR/AcrR family transcriptional regulator [Herbidospora sp. NBRC 101105]GLX94773.1 TetR family transcriptional regulator [Herbidospora sp. NBRC 101105]
MTDRAAGFQRARSAEQRELRREAILDAAARLLIEMPVSDVSLRELSRRVGLSKTNVVRYFETREAVFFELLNRSLGKWIEELPGDLASADPSSAEAVTDALARSLARRTLLCNLLSALGSELERNISVESARDFKLAHIRLLDSLAALLHRHLPALAPAAARELVSVTVVCTAGLWPFAHPSATVAIAQQDPALANTQVDFPSRLGRLLHLAATGLLVLPGTKA